MYLCRESNHVNITVNNGLNSIEHEEQKVTPRYHNSDKTHILI